MKSLAPLRLCKVAMMIDLLAAPTKHDIGTADINPLQILESNYPREDGYNKQTPKVRLAQQYRCELLDPDPPGLSTGWIEMKKPEVEMFS